MNLQEIGSLRLSPTVGNFYHYFRFTVNSIISLRFLVLVPHTKNLSNGAKKTT